MASPFLGLMGFARFNGCAVSSRRRKILRLYNEYFHWSLFAFEHIICFSQLSLGQRQSAQSIPFGNICWLERLWKFASSCSKFLEGMGVGCFFISVTPLNIAYYHHHESYRNHGCGNGGYYFISQHPELKHYQKELLMLDMQDM